jgi:hypothetical protein
MDIQNAVYALLKDLIALLGSIAIAYLSAYLKQHFNAKQLELAKTIAEEAVYFAEQVGNTLGIKGADKYKAALEKAKVLAAKVGIHLTDEQWQGLIESAVKTAINFYKDITVEQPQSNTKEEAQNNTTTK